MITGAIKSQIDQIWNAFWSGGISNPLEVIEQITYLLFLRRLDDLQTLEENRSARLKQPIARRIFPKGKDPKGRPYEQLRWSQFKHMAPSEMYAVVSEHVFPFLRTLGGDESTYAHHMKDARFTIPTAALLSKVVDLLDNVPMEDRDTKGDLYEYMLGKIATAGQNGQFRTPRHIIRLMVELTAPQPTDIICDPACGTAGFSDDDYAEIRNPYDAEQWRRALTFETRTPFYFLDPAFANTGGYRWWFRRLRDLIDGAGLDAVANGIMCIEHFPYKSTRYVPLGVTLPTQTYSFDLLRSAMRERRHVVIMRSERVWLESVPELRTYPYVRLKNHQNPYFSQAQMRAEPFSALISCCLTSDPVGWWAQDSCSVRTEFDVARKSCRVRTDGPH